MSLANGFQPPKSVFIYELITGGGLYCLPEAPTPSGSLLREGVGMLSAVVNDFQALGIEVIVLRDARLPKLPLPRARQHVVDGALAERGLFEQVTGQADASLIIAPEFDGLLLQRVRWAEACSAWLLSPASPFVEAASCKYACYGLWRDAGVPTIETCRISQPSTWPHLRGVPAITKPADGAGSEGILRWNSGGQIPPEIQRDENILIQPQVPGTPISCAVIGSGEGYFPLPAGVQHLGKDLKFLGGSLPLPEQLANRAHHLARRAAGALPPFRGYAGIDMILGPCPEGTEDVAVEVNPRITSSYIGLRRYLRSNLAQVMLDVVARREFTIEAGPTSVEYEIL